jgi:hypothetical protein
VREQRQRNRETSAMEIDITAPYLVGVKKATKFVIAPIAFTTFVELALQSGGAKNSQAAFNSALLRHRTKIVTDDGAHHDITPELLHVMPRPVAMPLVKFFDTEGAAPADETAEQKAERLAKQPAVLNDGDGLTTPILVKLGTPLEAAGKTISELEFMAKTYGDVESVLAETNELAQAVELIKSLAKPAGMLALPSWAVDMVSVQDGMFIERTILPRFLA